MYSSELEELFGLEKNPDLELAQLKYVLTLPEHKNDEEITSKVMEAVIKNNMGPWYALLCEDLGWKIDESLYEGLKTKNKEAIEAMDATIEDAEKNLAEMEVREAYLKKAEYYSIIGDKDNTITSLNQAYEKTMSPGQRLDIIFHLIRIGLFFLDYQSIINNIEKAQKLVDDGGDWDRRNRLRVYRGAYLIAIRDFKTACELFLDAATTFTSYELMDFNTFGRYTVYLCAIALPRQDIKEKVFRGSGIGEVLHHNTDLKEYLNSLYTCHYAEFFQHLGSVEKKLREDYLFHPHYHHYVREMKIIAYNQVLESYRSLSLKYMAEQFGVSVEYIDEELSRFISTGRLHCKIDRVGGVVETSRFNNKNTQFQMVVKQGDVLLTRVQKLSRVINI